MGNGALGSRGRRVHERLLCAAGNAEGVGRQVQRARRSLGRQAERRCWRSRRGRRGRRRGRCGRQRSKREVRQRRMPTRERPRMTKHKASRTGDG